ncbi:MFS general substrate transporter [Stemphylium lycopersici]|uniref:MFS general substrate transporter n=1 Tax=Stemphylium lycopersici TaxID=183478 RepID=A0A364N8S7_STELY|nr:major facilitator superfamily transporter [Stemphylium lycopersici]RAR00419.1 MFS general substrate transporter [Stemphylium lycopersici]RAR13738.1 MFS general substrate transporter [Stemphylium lycopersici]
MSEPDMEKRSTGSSTEEWKPQKRELVIMISLSFISLMVALDASILVTVLPVNRDLPAIAMKLNGTSIEAFWAGTSYLLTSAIFQPVIASISALFGRQQLLIIALFLFTLGRSIQGIGGGGIITLTQVIFCDIVPLRQRPKFFAMVLGAWSVGSIIGPVVGGALVENASWRWCFHINYPFCGIGFLIAIFLVRLNPVAELTLAQKLKRMDWIGACLFIGSMTSLLLGISWGGIQHPWSSGATVAPIIAGLFGLFAFFVWQLYRKEHTLLPIAIFRNWSAIAAFYGALINGLLILLDINTSTAVTSILLAVLGVGMGMVLTSINIGIQAISKPEDAAMAASMYGFLRSLGMPIGVAISGTVFSNSMSGKLSDLGLPTAIAHDSERYVLVLQTMEDSLEKRAILKSYMTGFDSVYIMITAISASAFLVSFIIKKHSMDKILLAQFSAR